MSLLYRKPLVRTTDAGNKTGTGLPINQKTQIYLMAAITAIVLTGHYIIAPILTDNHPPGQAKSPLQVSENR
ncbi:MAG: hypothetical protein EOM44_10120 [Bacteroidia bacterium]|nr:hypothetical protein [Bacteroidia bacterium]